MKKRVFVLLLALGMLLSCAQAEEITECMLHADNCQQPGVCMYCGASETDGAVMSWTEHAFDMENPVVTDTAHVLTCTVCGVENEESHWTKCTNGTTCETCGAADVVFSYTEHELDWGAYAYDASSHYYACASCGSKEYAAPHEGSCADQDTCYYCGATTEEGAVMQGTVHEMDEQSMYYDQLNHYANCGHCGEMIMHGPHWVMCTNPGTCEICGAEDVLATDGLAHYILLGNALEEGHEVTCTECGITYVEEHFTPCNDVGACMYCGWVGEEMTLAHSTGSGLPDCFDELQHWYTCSLCGGEAEKNAHVLNPEDPASCIVCSQPVTSVPVEKVFADALPEQAEVKAYRQTVLPAHADEKVIFAVCAAMNGECLETETPVRVSIDWAELVGSAEEAVENYLLVRLNPFGGEIVMPFEFTDGLLIFELEEASILALVSDQ